MRRVVMGVLLRRAEARLAHLSAYDPLTGLANRRTIRNQMEAFVDAGVHDQAAMLFFDLDRFKAINDTLGHAAGDQVLSEVADRLRGLTPAAAMAGRLGGDEFVVFCPGAGREEAETIAARLIKAMAAPIIVRGQALRVTASIGIASTAIEGVDRLMHEADEAMYAAKRRGGGSASVFEPDLHARTLDAMRIEQDMFRALESEDFEIHYQPVVTVSERKIVKFEALTRWRHPSRGWVPPLEFIPSAEETGLIVRLGAWVLTGAVRQIARWRRTYGDLSMAVNVSVRQLLDGCLHDLLADLLISEDVSADRIVLEITESVLLNETAVKQLHRLRGLGVRISLDDFGTGYSSLSYLKDLPVNALKIDRGFVEDLGANDRVDRIFRAIVDLAHTLDLETIAEGCETEQQWAVIAASGCDKVQGWLIAKAMPADDLETLLERVAGDR